MVNQIFLRRKTSLLQKSGILMNHKACPTQGGLANRISGTGYPRPASRVLSPGCTQKHNIRACVIAGNRGLLRYYNNLHWRGSPSPRAEPPGETLHSVQNPTEININAATLPSPSGKEYEVPSQSSIPNPRIYKPLHFRIKANQKNSGKI